MSYPVEEGKRRYDLEISEETHWHLVKMGAGVKMDYESFTEFMIESAVESLASVQEKPTVKAQPEVPLYKRLEEVLGLHGKVWPSKFGPLFEFLAAVIEVRGEQDLDRDPGETADWLRQEARKVFELDNVKGNEANV